jgi:hypothetical protein
VRTKRLKFLKGQKKALLASMKGILDKGLWNIGMEHRKKKLKQLTNRKKDLLTAKVAYEAAAEEGEDEEERKRGDTKEGGDEEGAGATRAR